MPARVAAHIICSRASASAASRPRARGTRCASAQRLAAADVAPRVLALARPRASHGRRGAARERPRRVRLERVAQDVHAARRDDRRRQRAVTRGSTTASLGRRRGDAMPVFARCAMPVEDRDARDLAAGAARRRARDVRRERPGHGARVAERRVDVRAQRRGVASRAGSPPSRCRSPSRRRARRSRRTRASRANAARRRRTTRRSARSRPRRTPRRRARRRERRARPRRTTAARGRRASVTSATRRGAVRARPVADLGERAAAERHARRVDRERRVAAGRDRLEMGAGHRPTLRPPPARHVNPRARPPGAARTGSARPARCASPCSRESSAIVAASAAETPSLSASYASVA